MTRGRSPARSWVEVVYAAAGLLMVGLGIAGERAERGHGASAR